MDRQTASVQPAAVPRRHPAARARPGSRKVPAWLVACAAVLTLVIGRLGEITPALSGIPTVKIGLALAAIYLVSAWGRLARNELGRSDIVRTAGWLLALAILSVPLSVWRMAGVVFLAGPGVILVAVFLGVYVTCTSRDVLRAYLTGLGAAAIALSIATLLRASPGRAMVSGSYDSNDLALVLVVVTPLMVARAQLARGAWRQAWLAAAGLAVFAALLTQSRGAFLGLIVAIVYLGLRGIDPARQVPEALRARQVTRRLRKAKSHAGPRLALLAVLVGASWFALPDAAQQRLASTFSMQGDYNVTDKEEGRIAIWTRALSAMTHRPWGHGVGAFIAVEGAYGGRYKAAHNALLEIGVELGWLGLALFLRLYWLAWRSLGEVQRQLAAAPLGTEQADVRIVTQGLRAALLAMLVSSLFLSQAYSPLLYALFALSAGLVVVYRAAPEPRGRARGRPPAAMQVPR